MSEQMSEAVTNNEEEYIHVILETTDKYKFGGRQLLQVNRKRGTIRWYREDDGEPESKVIDLDKIIFPFEIEFVHFNKFNEQTGQFDMVKMKYEDFHHDMVFKAREMLEKWQEAHPEKV